jgi:hypothetical protein
VDQSVVNDTVNKPPPLKSPNTWRNRILLPLNHPD